MLRVTIVNAVTSIIRELIYYVQVIIGGPFRKWMCSNSQLKAALLQNRRNDSVIPLLLGSAYGEHALAFKRFG